MEDKKYIVSIWANGDAVSGDYKGCGVCISDTHIITSQHVIADLEKSDISVGLIPDHEKGLKVAHITTHPEKDIAVLQPRFRTKKY